ncbi:MFS transporter [Kitasatospora sp. LaBMicrA B282]|uniref:MFS transporter n=1 Tax=Kitasatospora sp. LaBMicrA B282 TaxID=3420949 RepID=UPI003D124177
MTSQFFSTMGDVLTVTAVPFGVGVETGKISYTVVFWLVPAFAVLGASLLGKRVSHRMATARVDYAKLLLAIAVMEVGISLLALRFHGRLATLVISVLFVSLYAFAKEGIPRLLYQVAMYRYFVRSEEYGQLAGRKAGLDVLAALTATLLASLVVDADTWRYVLLFDALTFVGLALTLWLAGQDPAPEPAPATPAPAATAGRPAVTGRPTVTAPLSAIARSGPLAVLIAVPLFHGVNASFVNYLPLINPRLGLLAAGASITLLAVLRAPGMVLGLAYNRLSRRIPPQLWVLALPVVYVVATALFLWAPSLWSVGGVLLLGGLNTGVYAPSDAVIRNGIPTEHLVGFNVIVLRWLGVFQALACTAALTVFNTRGVDLGWLAVIVAASVVGALLLPLIHAKHPVLAAPRAEPAKPSMEVTPA